MGTTPVPIVGDPESAEVGAVGASIDGREEVEAADCGVVGRRRDVGGEAGVVRADSISRTDSPSLLSLSAIFKPLNMRSNWKGFAGC